MAQADGRTVAAAHGVAEDGAGVLVFDDAKIIFDVGDDVFEDLLVHGPAIAGRATNPTATTAATAGCGSVS